MNSSFLHPGEFSDALWIMSIPSQLIETGPFLDIVWAPRTIDSSSFRGCFPCLGYFSYMHSLTGFQGHTADFQDSVSHNSLFSCNWPCKLLMLWSLNFQFRTPLAIPGFLFILLPLTFFLQAVEQPPHLHNSFLASQTLLCFLAWLSYFKNLCFRDWHHSAV